VYVFRVKKFEAVGRLALFTALITLIAALLHIWIDIGHMGRAWKIIFQPQFGSVMMWMVWMYTAYFILTLAETWFLMRRDFAKGANEGSFKGALYKVLSLGRRDISDESAAHDLKVVRVLGTIGVPLAIAFHGGVGALFGVIAARPYWHSGMFPIMFLVGALASGGALLAFTVAFFFRMEPERKKELVTALGTLVLGLLALDLIMFFAETSIGMYSGVPGHTSVFEVILSGPYWWVNWIVQFGMGMVIPIILLSLSQTRRSIGWVGLACFLVVISFIAVRLNIVIPQLTVPELEGIPTAYSDSRLTTDYFPSLMEWLASVGIVGLCTIFFTLGYQLLPLQREETAHFELEGTPAD
jgi:molybdopterin-containing oxidoreductase family membrane subunit